MSILKFILCSIFSRKEANSFLNSDIILDLKYKMWLLDQECNSNPFEVYSKLGDGEVEGI